MVKPDKIFKTMNMYSYFISGLKKDDIRINSQTYLYILKRIMEFKVVQLFYSGVVGFPLNNLLLINYEIDYSPKMVDGKLKYNAPPDWKATKELWNIDPVAKELKKIVKIAPATKYTARFYITHPNFSFKFSCNSQVKRAIRIAYNEQARKGNPPISYKKVGEKYQTEKRLSDEN